MAEQFPNVPLDRCEKIAKAVRVTAGQASKTRTVSGDHLHSVLLKIAASLDELAVLIQQDQSGEI